MFNLFKKNIKPIDSNVGEIILSIKQDAKVDIQIIYDPNNIEAPKHIGQTLYLLNKGLFMKYFLEKLNSDQITNDHNIFSKDVIEAWDKMYELENINEPIIKPLNTFYKNAK